MFPILLCNILQVAYITILPRFQTIYSYYLRHTTLSLGLCLVACDNLQ